LTPGECEIFHGPSAIDSLIAIPKAMGLVWAGPFTDCTPFAAFDCRDNTCNTKSRRLGYRELDSARRHRPRRLPATYRLRSTFTHPRRTTTEATSDTLSSLRRHDSRSTTTRGIPDRGFLRTMTRSTPGGPFASQRDWRGSHCFVCRITKNELGIHPFDTR